MTSMAGPSPREMSGEAGGQDAPVAVNDAEVPVLAQVLARAFADDPAFSFIFPDAAVRARRLPPLFARFLQEDAGGMRWRTRSREAVTLWQNQAMMAPMPLWRTVMAAPLFLRLLGSGVSRALRMRDAIEAHYPSDCPWRLHIAGCDPHAQGQGHGGRAIRAGLKVLDARGEDSFLETATAANVSLYQSLGYRVISHWRVPGGGPEFWTMRRPAGGGAHAG